MSNIKKDYKRIEAAFKNHAKGVVLLDEVPAGYYRVAEIAKIMKLGDRATRRKLVVLVEKNVVERKHFMTDNNHANLPRRTSYFKFNEQKAHSPTECGTNKRPV
jgi:predicted ArsR family transcriptional regulator